MPQETGELKARIKAEGENLKDNLEEIQTRVKDALDWKVWYRNNTALTLGGLAVGGLLVSLMIPRSRPSAEPQYGVLDDFDESAVEPNGAVYSRPPRSNTGSRFHEVFDNTVSAVLGVAADKFQDFMSQALPGFREHYSSAQRNRMP